MVSIAHSLTGKLIVLSGAILLLGVSALSYFAIANQQEHLHRSVVNQADRLSTTIKLGTHYAMMLNSRDDITQIIKNIGSQEGIESLRIYNKAAQIKFSNNDAEVDVQTNIKSEACYVCHREEPPRSTLELDERIRFYEDDEGHRHLGIITPIHNEPGCDEGGCHFHPPEKKILGAIDVVVSLDQADRETASLRKRLLTFSGFIFVCTSAAILIFMVRFIRTPIMRLIRSTRQIARGELTPDIDVHQDDEVGQLASAISKMGRDIAQKQAELNRQRDEYQNLFAHVPCIITVQDRNYRIIRYNREFADKFKPRPGDYCYRAYKNRSEKCPNCPVELTFANNRSYCSEESGPDKDGNIRHWFVTTSPITNDAGEVVAAMEMCLDITPRKELERQLKKSEQKYQAIFSNIPNPVFVLDHDSLEILDCNASVASIYGYAKDGIVGRSFLDLFRPGERERFAADLREKEVIDRAVQIARDGRLMFVTIRISPTEYGGQKVWLVTTSDITKRLETEQQLIQAGKMTTLGEMATGVAHELNQPLTVIKAASAFFLRKLKRGECVEPAVLADLAGEIDGHVDRATRIINHLREFGRKPDMQLSLTQVGDVLRRAFDIFHQQLKLREIEVEWDLHPDLPAVMADAGRLEQVFVNLLINARDAIEERWAVSPPPAGTGKLIRLASGVDGGRVFVRVADNGAGIPKGLMERIFEPFFTTKKVGKGTGLGLSISYGIVQDMGGTIGVESREGEGTAFTVNLPRPEVAHG